MSSTKAMLTIGTVFLAAGGSFLAIGMATHILAFSVLGPVLMGLGVVFLATSKVQPKQSQKEQHDLEKPGQ